MSDTSPSGQERPGYEMVIERGKVREFAASVKSSNPAYFDDPNPVIPPTFLRAAAFWAPRRTPGAGAAAAAGRRASAGAAGAGAAGGGERGGEGAGGAQRGGGGAGLGLHAGQEYVFYGPPPRAGTKLNITSRQEDQYTKEGRRGGTLTFTVTVQEYRDETGNLVAIGRNTGVRTSRAANTGAGAS